MNKNNNNLGSVGVLETYGPLKTGYLYKIAKKGKDYYILRSHGRNIHVPINLINFNPYQKPTREQLEEEDFADYLEAYYHEEESYVSRKSKISRKIKTN